MRLVVVRPLRLAVAGWLQRHWPVLIILALPVLILSPSLFGGHAVTADDTLVAWPPWTIDLASAQHVPANSLLSDGPLARDAWLSLTRQELTAGRFPFWNPMVAGGTPLLSAGQPAALYPLTWLAGLLPYPSGLTLVALLKWWLVGLGMYLFARSSLKLDRLPALVPALAFMLGSFWVVWLTHEVGEAVTWLPWLLWATERVIRQPSARRAAVLALIAGLIGLTGHPEMSFHVMLGGTLYALWLGLPTSRQNWRARLTGLGVWSGSVVLGIALAAIQYLPTLATLGGSLAVVTRSTVSVSAPLPLTALLTWVVPNIYGNPAYNTRFWGPGNYNEVVYFAGGVSLVLAIIALGALRSSARRSEVAFFAGQTLVIGGWLYGLPPFVWLGRLPILDVDAWARLNVLVVFSVCCLAGIGMEHLANWKERPIPAATQTQKRRFAVWPLAWTGVLLAALCLLAILTTSSTSLFNTWIALWVGLALLILWGTVLALVSYRRGRLPWRKAQFVLLGLLLLDLLTFAVPYIPQPPASLAYPETPTMLRLQQTVGAARMAAAGWILPPDSGTPYALHDLRAYEPSASARYMRYMLKLDPELEQTSQVICCAVLTCPSLTLLSVASVDYYATLPDVDANRCQPVASGQALTSGPLVPLWTQGGITLWRNTQARPRFYFADQIIPSSGENQTLAALPSLSADGRDAIIEGATPAASPTTSDVGTIHAVTDQPGEITLQTQTDTARWLVIDEGYDAGWQADIDGASTSVHPANEMFQAVYVPAGAHTIHLVYRPVAFVPGALLSGLALLVVLGLLVADAVLRRRAAAHIPAEREAAPVPA